MSKKHVKVRWDWEAPILDYQVIEALEKDYTCPSCKNLLFNTIITGCGARLCRYCFLISMRDNKECPACHKHCGQYFYYINLDRNISAAFQKMGAYHRGIREEYVRTRKILQTKFDLEAIAIAEGEATEVEAEEPPGDKIKVFEKSKASKVRNTGEGSKQKKRPKKFRPGNVQPNPFGKLLTKNSTGSLLGDFLVRKASMMQNGGKHVKLSKSLHPMQKLFENVKPGVN